MQIYATTAVSLILWKYTGGPVDEERVGLRLQTTTWWHDQATKDTQESEIGATKRSVLVSENPLLHTCGLAGARAFASGLIPSPPAHQAFHLHHPLCHASMRPRGFIRKGE